MIKKRTVRILLFAAMLLLLASCAGPADADVSSRPAAANSGAPAADTGSPPTEADSSVDLESEPEPDGFCGDDVTWRLDGHTLILSGTGATYDYTVTGSGDCSPWREDFYDCAGEVREVIIEPGITRIGTGIFRRHTNLLKVTIPDTVTEIGNAAFSACEALKAVDLPDGLTIIDTYAFSSCRLSTITIPEKVENIGPYAFDYNPLVSVTIAGRSPVIDWDAFRSSSRDVELTDVYYIGSEEDWNAMERHSLDWQNLTVHYNSTGE